MVQDEGVGGPPVVVPRATAVPTGVGTFHTTTSTRPPSISVSTHGARALELQPRTPPPGSPMDVDFEGSSPSAKARKPVITVLDWDDTLCPSSWLYREGLLAGHGLIDSAEAIPTQPSSFGPAKPTLAPKKRKLNAEDKHALRLLEENILALLHTARQLGPVFIVTAAKLHWVRQCAEAFLPNVLHILIKSESVHVISAREFYLDQSSRMGPHQSRQAAEGTPLAWKAVTFEAVCSHLRVEDYVRRTRSSHGTRPNTAPIVVDFVSVGDSLCERDACRFLATKAPNLLNSKTIKFLDQPSLLEMIEEVKMTKALLDQICRYSGNLDLHITRSRSCLQMVQLDTPPRPPTAPPVAGREIIAPRPKTAMHGVQSQPLPLVSRQPNASEAVGPTTSL